MSLLNPGMLMAATFFGVDEVVLIAVLGLVLIATNHLPGIGRGVDDALHHLRKELDRLAHDTGKSVGGIFGTAAAEALTPENQISELYDPAVFRPSHTKRSYRQWLRDLWETILRWLRIKH